MNGTISIGDTDLHYTAAGSGEPFVFVHGAAASMIHGEYLSTYLSKAYRFISYSQRFHLPNDPAAPGHYHADQHADDLILLLEKLNITSCKILGHSYGGMVVLAAAVKKPRLFSAIYLAEPGLAFLINGKAAYQDLIRERNDAFRRVKVCFEEGRSAEAVATLMRYANGHRGFKTFPETIRMDMTANAGALYRLVFETQTAGLNETQLAQLKIPVRIFLGSQCSAIYKAVASEIKHLIPETQIIYIDDCAHDLIYLKAELWRYLAA